MRNVVRAYLAGFKAGKSVRARMPRQPSSIAARTASPEQLPLFPSAPPCGAAAAPPCAAAAAPTVDALAGSASPEYTPSPMPLSPDYTPSPMPVCFPVSTPMYTPSAGAGSPPSANSPLRGSPTYTPASSAWLPSPRRSSPSSRQSSPGSTLAASERDDSSSYSGLSLPQLSPPAARCDMKIADQHADGSSPGTPLIKAAASESRLSPSPPAIQRRVRHAATQEAPLSGKLPSSGVREETPEIFSEDDETTHNDVDSVDYDLMGRDAKRAKMEEQARMDAWEDRQVLRRDMAQFLQANHMKHSASAKGNNVSIDVSDDE